MKRQYNVQIVFVDHLQLMKGMPEYRGNIRMEITDITRNLKGYAKTLEIPIVVISHLRKSAESENHRPLLSDLKETGSIGEDADIAMFLHRPKTSETINKFSEKGKNLTEEEAEHIVELLIRKNRGGATGMLYLHWEPTYTLFSDLEI
jgi:replicative DNA helicase